MEKTNRRHFLQLASIAAASGGLSAFGQTYGKDSAHPMIGIAADSGPERSSEAGVGCLMAYADKLWVVTYVSEPSAGSGTGLFEVDGALNLKKHHESNGVYANRMHHLPSNQISIGPYMIDMHGNIRIIDDLVDQRLTATMPHLEDRENKIYILTMEGLMHEVDVHTLKTKQLFDLTKILDVKGDPHFKGAFTGQNRVVVANNTYAHPNDDDGRLAEWDGEDWRILEKKPFMEVTCHSGVGQVMFASGWDDISCLFKMRTDGEWHTYRLPKAGQSYEHFYCTEWMRIREVETERLLMDLFGMFYELPMHVFHGASYGIRPICSHLRIVPDFCSFRGMLVLGGNEAATAGGNFHSPQSQSGLWFGKTDDLWKFGKPKGWGGVWRKTQVKAGEPSDPFLMTNFDQKVLHLYQEDSPVVDITIEVDFLGYGEWKPYATLELGRQEYKYHTFPRGFSAHWVRLKASRDCTATAEFMYT